MCSKEKNQVSSKELSKQFGRTLTSLLKDLQYEIAQEKSYRLLLSKNNLSTMTEIFFIESI